jgi:arylsulfatase A-like enzyme
MPNPPNILLIVADQWRGDCLGAAGHPVIQTPHLDALAADGIRFSHAYAAVPSCIAARASLLTGLHQRNHGRVGYRDGVPWTYPTTLAGTFAAAGYHTQAVGKMHVYPTRSLQGFHNVVLHDGYLHAVRHRDPHLVVEDDYLWDLQRRHGVDADYIDSGIGCNGYAVSPWPYDQMLHPTAWVTTQSIDFLRRRDPSKPFFLMTSYHRPHPPLDPPQAYLDIYRDVRLPRPARGDWDGGEGLPHISHRMHMIDSPKPRDAAQIDRARRAYYAQCTFIDHQINRLIMALIEHHVLADTAIVFVADHGDMLYDHELTAKALPYEGSARVPLIIRPRQGTQPLPGGSTVDAPVELRDILPTLCDLAGIPIPAGLDGHSLMPFVRGEQTAWRDWLHGEHEWGRFSNQWLTDGRAKYAWFSQTGREQLFDLAADPTECHDLAEERPDELAVWRARLVQELAGREEGYVQDGQLVVGRPATAVLSTVQGKDKTTDRNG